jgi:hypothetical protein
MQSSIHNFLHKSHVFHVKIKDKLEDADVCASQCLSELAADGAHLCYKETSPRPAYYDKAYYEGRGCICKLCTHYKEYTMI